MGTFPCADTPQAFAALGRGDPRLLAGATALCAGLGLGPVRLIASGSLPVFEAGPSQVLKLYPPCFAGEAEHERRILALARAGLGAVIPAVVASGEAGGWRYLLLERARGEPLDRLWPSLGTGERLQLARETGGLLAALHRLPVPPGLEPSPDWRSFVRAQSRSCPERQRALGLASPWLEQIPAFLTGAGIEEAAPRALLHTEVMREHLFAERGPSGWTVSGLIDFEPALAGAPEYELASVGLFLTRGSGPALRALLRAYGYAEAAIGPGLQRRLLAYALVHRYGNLPRYLERLPVAPPARTLEALALRWWAVEEEGEIAGA